MNSHDTSWHREETPLTSPPPHPPLIGQDPPRSHDNENTDMDMIFDPHSPASLLPTAHPDERHLVATTNEQLPSRTRPQPQDNYDYSNTSSILDATERFTNDSVEAMNSLRDQLPEAARSWFWLAVWFTAAMVILGLIIGFWSKIFSFLEALASFIKDLGIFGPVVITFCLFVASFPPMIGYSSIVTMAGYIYGFFLGYLIVFTGALLGAVACFFFCRKWFKGQVRKLLGKNKSLKGVLRTVEKRGFRLLVLIRLAPYPYNIMNALLSATHIPLSTYTLATTASLIKLTLHVYIGSTLSSLAEDDDDNNGDNGSQKHGKRLKVAVMVMGIILGVGLGLYIWNIAKREVAISEATRAERRRRRRFEQRHQRRRGRSSNDQDPRENHASRGLSGQAIGLGIDIGSEDNEVHGFELGNRSADQSQAGVDLSTPGRTTNPAQGDYGLYSRDDSEDEATQDQTWYENRSLFGRSGGEREHRGEAPDWRNVNAAGYSSTESESSDLFDDSENDEDNQGDLENGLRSTTRTRGNHHQVAEEEDTLDFSAHHLGVTSSPWDIGDGDDDNETGPAEPQGHPQLGTDKVQR